MEVEEEYPQDPTVAPVKKITETKSPELVESKTIERQADEKILDAGKSPDRQQVAERKITIRHTHAQNRNKWPVIDRFDVYNKSEGILKMYEKHWWAIRDVALLNVMLGFGKRTVEATRLMILDVVFDDTKQEMTVTFTLAKKVVVKRMCLKCNSINQKTKKQVLAGRSANFCTYCGTKFETEDVDYETKEFTELEPPRSPKTLPYGHPAVHFIRLWYAKMREYEPAKNVPLFPPNNMRGEDALEFGKPVIGKSIKRSSIGKMIHRYGLREIWPHLFRYSSALWKEEDATKRGVADVVREVSQWLDVTPKVAEYYLNKGKDERVKKISLQAGKTEADEYRKWREAQGGTSDSATLRGGGPGAKTSKPGLD